MGVGFEGVTVGLDVGELGGEALAEGGLGHTGGPETEAHGEFFGNGLAILAFLGEDN